MGLAQEAAYRPEWFMVRLPFASVAVSWQWGWLGNAGFHVVGIGADVAVGYVDAEVFPCKFVGRRSFGSDSSQCCDTLREYDSFGVGVGTVTRCYKCHVGVFVNVMVTDGVFDGGCEVFLVRFVHDGCFTPVYAHRDAFGSNGLCFAFVVKWELVDKLYDVC